MNLKPYIDREDIKAILTEMKLNLPSNKYDIGQKVISELCSKLYEQVGAQYFAKKLGIPVVAANHDVDPDNLFKFETGDIPLEIKVAMGGKGCRWRGGGLSNRSSDYLLVARNRETTEFFVALTYLTKNSWLVQKTEYYAPFYNEELLFNNPHVVLWGSFDTETKGKRKGLPIIKLEGLTKSNDDK